MNILLRMQEMAFQGFKFQKFSGGEYRIPWTPVVMHSPLENLHPL
jgi:hypothetical protein